MNCVAGMIVDLLLSARFLSAVPLGLSVLLLKLVLEQKTLLLSVYFTSHVLEIWLYPYLAWLCFPEKCLSFSVTFMWKHTRFITFIYVHVLFWSIITGRHELCLTLEEVLSPVRHITFIQGSRKQNPPNYGGCRQRAIPFKYFSLFLKHLQTLHYQCMDITEGAKNKHIKSALVTAANRGW